MIQSMTGYGRAIVDLSSKTMLIEIRSLNRGCGIPLLYLPPGVEVTEGSNGIAILGLVIAIGAAAGGGGSGGSGSSSSN